VYSAFHFSRQLKNQEGGSLWIVQQFFVGGLAHSSYLLGGQKTCAVIDPRRDIQVYLDTAKASGLRITHILENHLHADFVSGHLDVAQKTGAKIYVPRSGKCTFDHIGVQVSQEVWQNYSRRVGNPTPVFRMAEWSSWSSLERERFIAICGGEMHACGYEFE